MNKKQRTAFLADINASSIAHHNKQLVEMLLDKHLKPIPKAPRIRNTKAPQLQSLFEWEAGIGSQLRADMLTSWIREREFCPKLVGEMIEEFRLEMIGKNKQYADFKATFQTYLNKGYLSKKVGQMLLANSPYKSTDGVTINTRGVRI